MGFFSKLFGKKENEPQKVTQTKKVEVSPIEEKEWEEIPNYVEAAHDECELVSVMATSIAAGDRPDSSFEVTKILEQNPEAKKVSIIATSIAAIDHPDSKFIVKKIYKKING